VKLAIKQVDLGPDVLFATARTPDRMVLVLNTEAVVNRFRYRATIRRIARAAIDSRRQERRAG
jgi:hypothetical protein